MNGIIYVIMLIFVFYNGDVTTFNGFDIDVKLIIFFTLYWKKQFETSDWNGNG